MRIFGNVWKAMPLEYDVTPRTLITFEFRSDKAVEIAAIGVDTDTNYNNGTAAFQLSGNQTWTRPDVDQLVRAADPYATGSGWQTYTLPIGELFAGQANWFFLVCDADTSVDGEAWVRNVRLYEPSLATQTYGDQTDRQQANTKEEDPTGLLNEGFRYRDLTTGTFLTRDPLGFVDGPNVYTYVVQNPWSKFDPLGLAGYFFDGTGMDYENDPDHATHVAALYEMYDGKRYYEHGVGTRTDEELGNMSGRGARERLDDMFKAFEAAYANGDTDIDIFGFSRGAAMAREFTNMIAEKYPDAEIRYLGLFDTVAQIGLPDAINNNPGIRLDIPSNVGFVSHAVAMNEHRNLFPLTSVVSGEYGGYEMRFPRGRIAPNDYSPSDYRALSGPGYWEQPFSGVHSDVGGGYVDGGNRSALWWTYNLAKSKGVPLDHGKLDSKQMNFFMKQKTHDSRDRAHASTSWADVFTQWRDTRVIYNGNLSNN